MEYNWRYSHGYWWYQRWVFNIALLARYDPGVFTDIAPAHTNARLSALR